MNKDALTCQPLGGLGTPATQSHLTNVEFEALNTLFLGYLSAFHYLPAYIKDAYYLRAQQLGRHTP